MSDGSRHVLAYGSEATYGSAAASLSAVRHTSCDLRLEKDQFVSAELNGLRQVVDVRHGAKRVGGGFGIELSDNSHDDFLEALLGGTWSTNVVKCGSTRRSFTFERQYPDIPAASPGTIFERYTGCEINSLSLSIRPNAIVTGTFGVVGQTMATATAALDASLTAAATGAVFDAMTGTITEGGAAIATITALDLNITNNLVPRYVVGTGTTIRPAIGNIDITGRVTAHFEDHTLLAKWVAETNSEIVVTLSDGTNTIQFDIPRINYTTGVNPTTDSGPIIQTFDFTAMYNVADTSALVVTRSA